MGGHRPRRRACPLGARSRHLANEQGIRILREFSPCPLCRPPNELAAADNDHAQHNPPVHPYRNHARTKDEYRRDHHEIIRSRVAAVSTAALSRIEDARCAHPDESNGPDDDSKRRRREQSDKDSGVRKPPRQRAAAFATQPIARGLDRSVGHTFMRYSTKQRSPRRGLRSASVDRAPTRRSRTRSNVLPSAAAALRNQCIHRRTSRRRLAWSPVSPWRSGDR
jgi:hypothetical protein